MRRRSTCIAEGVRLDPLFCHTRAAHEVGCAGREGPYKGCHPGRHPFKGCHPGRHPFITGA